MKHIHKRFLFEKKISAEVADLVSKTNDLSFKDLEKIKLKKNQHLLVLTDKDYMYSAFQVDYKGKKYFIPEPDPVLIYFNNAYFNYKEIEKDRDSLYSKLDIPTYDEKVINDLYKFFGLCSGFTIFLFTAMESFVNHLIPEDFIYSVPKKNRTEIYNRDQIFRYLSFTEKIEKVLLELTKKNFQENFPLKAKHIDNLKEFRDMVVHTKKRQDGSTPYDYMFKKALHFKYEETIHAVRDFINFYESEYIMECDCGLDI